MRRRPLKIVALHGVGASGASFAAMREAWQRAIPDLEFATPDAPNPFDKGSAGFQWFGIRDITDENRLARVVDARAGFDATLSRALAELGAAPDAADAAFVGFSQGTIMSLDAVASGRWRPAAVIGIGGRLANPKIEPARVDSPSILIVHGEADPVIPVALAHEAADRFGQAGYAVARRIFPAMRHAISPDAAIAALDFLRDTTQGTNQGSLE